MKIEVDFSAFYKKEHALLTLVVAEAAPLTKSKSSFLGRTAIQKIVYFLQREGVPMRYSFDLYTYGPFCQEVLFDMDDLQAMGAVKDSSTDPSKYSNYIVGEKAKHLLDRYSEFVQSVRPMAKPVVELLAPLKPDTLEAVATLDYVFRYIRARGGHGPWKDRVVDRFQEVKPGRFERSRIEKLYDQMASIKLVQP